MNEAQKVRDLILSKCKPHLVPETAEEQNILADQLWAEAVHKYKAEGSQYLNTLDPELADVLKSLG